MEENHSKKFKRNYKKRPFKKIQEMVVRRPESDQNGPKNTIDQIWMKWEVLQAYQEDPDKAEV